MPQNNTNILSYNCGIPKSEMGLAGLKIKVLSGLYFFMEALGENISLPFQVSKGCPFSLTYGKSNQGNKVLANLLTIIVTNLFKLFQTVASSTFKVINRELSSPHIASL